MATVVSGNDPLYAYQWYLRSLGGDMTRIWSEFDGTGVRSAVYDDGLEKTHADLAGNYDASRELLISGVRADPSASLSAGGGVHGTAVAGIIAGVANDGIGGVGLSMGAKITGVDVFHGAASGGGMLTAIRAMSGFDTVNNSWNWTSKYADPTSVSGSFGQQFSANLKYAADTGRGGLGTLITDSAGNDWYSDRRDANTSGFAQSRHTITVGAIGQDGDVAYYSNRGADLLVSAPSSGGGAGIYTTDRTGAAGYDAGDYTSAFGGTSAAAPIVTAVTNLMLDANDRLGWRDVQKILAITADHTTPTSLGGPVTGQMEFGWTINRAQNVDNGGMHFSNDVGYGRVDAFEAVRYAEVWSNFGAAGTSANERSLSASATVNRAILDNQSTSFSLAVSGGLVVQHADLTLTLTHGNVNDLRVELVSASGTSSVVLTPGTGAAQAQSNWTWTFGSEAFMGEQAAGGWTVRVTDTATGATGTVASARLDLYGDAPTADDVHSFTSDFAKMVALDPSRAVLHDANGGTDWVNVAGATGDLAIDLHAGAASTLNGAAYFRIDATSVVENAVTGDGNDTLSGNDVANVLMGMRGNDVIEGYGGADTLDGGQGTDTATYLHSAAAVDVDLTRATQLGGDALGDRLVSIENLTGSAFHDRLAGDAGANVIDGGAGNDVIEGRGGADTIAGGAGTDTASYERSAAGVDVDLARAVQSGGDAQGDRLSGIENLTGSALADRLAGDAGNNVLAGGAGADYLHGGLGTDTADYSASSAGVDVDLNRATQLGGDAQGDQLVSIERVVGSAFADRLAGTAAAETLEGGAGNDTLAGSGGGDVMNGGDGTDAADYTASAAAVSANLATGRGSGGFAEGDTYISVENLVGSRNADTLYGNAGANRLEGGEGNDYLDGGAGNDALLGGAGADRLMGGDGDDILTGGIGNDMLTGGAGRDVFRFDAKGFGSDIVSDFARGNDILDMRGLGLSFSDMRIVLSGTTETVTVNRSGWTDQIVLAGQTQKLDATDFLFA